MSVLMKPLYLAVGRTIGNIAI